MLAESNSARPKNFAGGKAILSRPNGVPTGRPRSASLRASGAVTFHGSGNNVPLSLGGCLPLWPGRDEISPKKSSRIEPLNPCACSAPVLQGRGNIVSLSLGGEGRGEGARTLNKRSNVRDEGKTRVAFQGSELNRGHKDFQSFALPLNIEYSTLNVSVPAPNPNGVPSLSLGRVASQILDYQVESNPVQPSPTNCLQLPNCSTARQIKASQTQSNLVKVNQGKSGKGIRSAVFNSQRSMTVSSTLSVECSTLNVSATPLYPSRECGQGVNS